MDFTNFLTPELTTMAYGLFGLTALRFVLGSYSALKDGTFVLSAVGAFIRSQVLGRVFPILTTAIFAQSSGNTALVATAAALSVAYLAETTGAIQEALSTSTQADVAEKTIEGTAKGNPVPQD